MSDYRAWSPQSQRVVCSNTFMGVEMEEEPQSVAPPDRTIVLTDSAQRNIENMQKRVWDIQNAYGIHSPEAEKAQFSFSQMLMTIMRWPGRVMAEDDLSLIIDSSITLGLIFHHVRHKQEDGSWVTDPLLGEWSSHS